jgi:hypothetical protein
VLQQLATCIRHWRGSCFWFPQAVVEDGRFAATLAEQSIISVSDMLSETTERLEFKEPVVKMGIGAWQHDVIASGHHAWSLGQSCVAADM